MDVSGNTINNPENSGNEINGLTLGGVGSGTTLDHIEVAYNLDDGKSEPVPPRLQIGTDCILLSHTGFEFFGGTVNGKYLSAIYCGDDAFDTDEGYQGSLQLVFVCIDFESTRY